MSQEKFYDGGVGRTVAAASRSPQDVTAAELMTSFGANPSREPLRVTRFPVSAEEFAKLKTEAIKAKPAAAAKLEKDLQIQEDLSPELETETAEKAEYDPTSRQVLAPALLASFQTLQQTAFRPPDCTIAVGPSHVMVAANTIMAVYSKTGTLQFTWDFAVMFRPVLPPGARVFDPVLAYDHYFNRWIVALAATRASPQGAWFMLGVSQTSNPFGAYWVWALDATLDGSTPSNNWGDYPHLGFDYSAIYITANMFKFGGGFSYVKIRILSKSQLYAGSALGWYDFWNLKNPDGSLSFTVQPCVHFTAPPVTPFNIPAYFINALWPSGTSLTKWRLINSGTGLTLSRTAVNCMRYNLPPDGQQLGGPVPIETNDTRLLNAIYQFSPGGEKRLWTCHTSNHTWTGSASPVSVLQWYEIDVSSNSIVQQGLFGAPGKYYYFPAIQTDMSRNAFIVFGRSSPTEFAQLRRTGRRVTAPLNTLEGSALVKAGESYYTGGRWGDYFGICRDAADPRIVWMNGEYAESGNTWGTWTCSTRF
jgi:hypothetical protein